MSNFTASRLQQVLEIQKSVGPPSEYFLTLPTVPATGPLVYDFIGATGVFRPLNLFELADVNTSSASDGDILVYDANTQIWNAVGPSGANGVIDTYTNTSTLSISTLTFTPIPLDDNRTGSYDTNTYTHTVGSSDITILKVGRYKITAKTSFTVSGGRTGSEMRLELNTNPIPGSNCFGYHRSTAIGQGTLNTDIIIELNVNDVIRMTARRYNGSGTLNLISNATSINITRLL